MTATLLKNRAIIRVASPAADEDVRSFIQGLVTNDVSGDLPVWGALLTSQGKALFDFLIWNGDKGELLIDCEEDAAEALVKRLSLYRLRRKIVIEVAPELAVHWSPDARDNAAPDPRLPQLGYRWLASAGTDEQAADEDWLAHRLALGVPEGRADFGDGETLWLECNAAELNGVSFEKGCYIGQENTARMNWRQKINRRLVVVPLERSDEKRRKSAYSKLGLAVDHLRVADIDAAFQPGWMQL